MQGLKGFEDKKDVREWPHAPHTPQYVDSLVLISPDSEER